MPEAEEQDIKRVMDLLEDAKKKEETRHEPTPEENCAIRDCIVNHKGFATKFFCEILSPMMNGFVNKIRNIYDVDVALHDVRTIIYTELYDGGNWTRLRSYEGRCSIFTWVSRVASQVLVSQLVKEGIISLSNGRMAMNTSLTLKSMKSREERQLVIDLVDVPQWHDLLTSIYVKDRGVVETMGVLCMTEQVFKRPVFVTDYPKDIKAFYMKQNPDGRTVAAMDCLVPGIGEIIGGSQREEDYDKLLTRMKELGMEESQYDFYLDLRKYGTVRHAGFGLGFERAVMYITGMENIRDVLPFPRTVNNCDI